MISYIHPNRPVTSAPTTPVSLVKSYVPASTWTAR
jgi:hypothetical protein